MTSFGVALVLTAGILYTGILAAVLFILPREEWPLWKVVLCRGLSGVLATVAIVLFLRYVIPPPDPAYWQAGRKE